MITSNDEFEVIKIDRPRNVSNSVVIKGKSYRIQNRFRRGM